MYWPGYQNGFIWDDLSYLVHSPAFRDPAQWQAALFRPPTGEAVFRPLALFSFAAQLWAGQTGPAPFHVANFLIHAVNVFLVTLLAYHVAARNSPAGVGAASAVVAGLLYGLHPALTESVLGIAAGRFDLMMSTFLLSALLLDRGRPATGWMRTGGASLLFFCALLCKETAVGFLAALPLAHLAFSGVHGVPRTAAIARLLSGHRRIYAGLLCALAAYLLFRFVVLGPQLGLDRVMARYDSIGSIGQRIAVVAASLAHYVTDAIWVGVDLVPNRILPLPIDGFSVTLSLAAVLGALALAWAAVRFTEAGRAAGWWTLAFLAALVPVSNVIPAPTHMGELQIASRYLTFPLVFASLALATAPPALAAWRAGALKLFWVAAAGGAIVFAGIVHATIPLWKDEGVFFRWAIAKGEPTSWQYLYINLGAYYLNTGDIPGARDAFLRAAQLPPKSARLGSLAWYNLGNAESKLGNAEPAMAAFRSALALEPDNVYALAALAELERSRQRAGVAVALLEQGIKRQQEMRRAHPDRGLLHLRLGLAYADLARRDEAVRELTLARDLLRHQGLRDAAEEALRALAGPVREATRMPSQGPQ